ncbi:MAG: hypothetical protein AAF170_18085 [Bacteroidota bacterium]
MPIIARDSSEERHLPASGLRNAVCVDVIDNGMQESTWDGKTRSQHKITIVWELDADHPHFGGPERINRRYTLSLNDAASLTKDLESWRGRAFTEEEKAGFDVERLIGVPATLNVVHNPPYANVKAVLPHQGHAPKLVPSESYVRVQDRPDSGAGAEVISADRPAHAPQATQASGFASGADLHDQVAAANDALPF